MGNQVSDNPEYQRMGNQPQQSRNKPSQRQQRQQEFRRAQSQPLPKQQQVSIDSAVDTLQSMFMLVDREVLRLVLMEQCGGNLDSAVETLLTMQAASVQPAQQPQQPQSAQHQRSPSPKSRVYGPNESILYDDNMRPIIMTDHFLQPPSFYLSKYYGLSAAQINNLQIQQQSQAEVARVMARKQQRQQSGQQVTVNMDPSIIGQWTNLMAKYKFKNRESMEREREMEPKPLEKCGSLVRVIFIMKLYDRICNDSGEAMNEKCGELMHEYLTRGFKEYSLTQFINDCNYLIQVHQFGGDALKAMTDIEQRNKLENQMRSYFGYRDVMKDRIIQRILSQQDNKDSNKSYSDIEVERDILDKYHRCFYHPLN